MRFFNQRLERSRGPRALVLLFAVTATVFSVLPLLRYFRGHTIFDYELWYATGRHMLAGGEIYFFRAGKYDFMFHFRSGKVPSSDFLARTVPGKQP